MSLAVLKSRALAGMEAQEVSVEVHLANGLPAFTIVGLADTEVKESKDRVRAAIQNGGFTFPAQRITVNLAPADLPKESGRFDLPIALGILAASGQIPARHLAEYEFAGELSLSGALRPIRGTLAMAIASRRYGGQCGLILPVDNADEAALVADAAIYPAATLLQVCRHFAAHSSDTMLVRHVAPARRQLRPYPDFADVKGQFSVKRGLEVAAAGNHSVLLVGPPGAGKTMLAVRFPGLLPDMSDDEALQAAAVLSLSGNFRCDLWKQRPFRAPHHTASGVALVGGGSLPRPGEISLAHHGVLFLDELPEFEQRVLDVLREPLESGHITISRAARQADFPARFQLIAAMIPALAAMPVIAMAAATARLTRSAAISAVSPARYSIASTSRWKWGRWIRSHWPIPPAAKPAPVSPHVCRRRLTANGNARANAIRHSRRASWNSSAASSRVAKPSCIRAWTSSSGPDAPITTSCA